MERDIIVFNGIRFIRYPESKQYARRHYYQPSINYALRTAQGIGLLHQEVYKHTFGPIPEGCVVHHRDGNHLNNDPANLEAIPQSGHARHHANLEHDDRVAHLDRIRAAGVATKRSPENRAKMREHGIHSWDDKPYYDATCEQCGKVFQSRNPRGPRRWCSKACDYQYRKANGTR